MKWTIGNEPPSTACVPAVITHDASFKARQGYAAFDPARGWGPPRRTARAAAKVVRGGALMGAFVPPFWRAVGSTKQQPFAASRAARPAHLCYGL